MGRPRLVLDVDVARRMRVTVPTVRRYCRQGRIEGARFDRVRWHWVIPLPLRFLLR